jgi:hypothetical protein
LLLPSDVEVVVMLTRDERTLRAITGGMLVGGMLGALLAHPLPAHAAETLQLRLPVMAMV